MTAHSARRITVLVPAHKGGTVEGSSARPQILEMLDSLHEQTVQPSQIVVLANNVREDDDMPDLARGVGAEVLTVPPNPHKKAGALNWWLDSHLGSRSDGELIMVMDADTILDPGFLENALKYIDQGYHAVGGVFLGKEGGGFVGMLQRNEYARYARDVERKKGKTLVLTGTATLFTVECLKKVIAGRESGIIPNSAPEGERAQVYDTKALTEDNELTFALLHLGYKIIAPRECGLATEVMETWRDLWKQRYRWKRGAVENNNHYGVTRYTAKYWGLQIWGIIGILVTAIYLTTLGFAIATGSLRFYVIWIIVTIVFALERIITVRSRGWKQMLISGVLIIEMPYDICLQAVQARALVDSTLRTRQEW